MSSFSFTSSDGASALDTKCVTVDFSVGESIDLTNQFDCAGVSIDNVQGRDPCEGGTHQWRHRVTCTPTADDLDYTCECDQDVVVEGAGFKWYSHDNGRKYYHYTRRDKQFYADAVGFCEVEGYYDYIDSNAKLECFKNYLKWIEGSNSRDRFNVWWIFKNHFEKYFCAIYGVILFYPNQILLNKLINHLTVIIPKDTTLDHSTWQCFVLDFQIAYSIDDESNSTIVVIFLWFKPPKLVALMWII